VTVYVVPCGVSIISGLVTKADKGPPDARPSRLAKSAADRGRGVIARRDDQVIGWWAGQAAGDAAAAKLTSWDPRLLSAETSTLAASTGPGRLRRLLDGGDQVLLLASDTDPGVAAALLVAQHIAGLALPDVAYLTTPEGLPDTPLRAGLTPGTLTIVRLRGLDPRNTAGGFIDAVAGIGRALRAAFDVGQALEVHLTGGFKATLLHTLAMTEVLYSLDPGRVKACYVFEGDDDSRVATSIGMRQFLPPYIRDMRSELAQMRHPERDRPTKLGTWTFEGMAWTAKDGLNAFGYGYLAVLGERLAAGRPGPTGS
jgi:hypothetical protein